jgi:hypothetical protein
MDVKHVEAFGDLLLVVQQVAGVYQCFDGSLNAYLDKCLEIIALFVDFTMQHLFRNENTMVNDLAQQASSFWSNWEKLYVLEKLDVLVCQIGWSGFQSIHNAEICSAEAGLAKSDGSVSEIEGFEISRNSDNLGETTTTEPDDWRTPLVCYIENPGHIADRKVGQQGLKYVMLDNTLYRRNIDGLLLKCLGSDHSKIAMGMFMKGFVVPISQLIKWNGCFIMPVSSGRPC